MPERYRLETLRIAGPDPAIRDVDVADIPWALPGDLLEFGIAYPDIDGRGVRHCGAVPLDVALGIEAALGGGDLPWVDFTGSYDLSWTARDAHGSVRLIAITPGGPTGCPTG